jgi:hypothetical protein
MRETRPGTAHHTSEVRVANHATYWPVAPIDLAIAAPMIARALLGVSPVGRILQGVALGAYLASAARDWRDRQGIIRIDFYREFGADLGRLLPMPRDVREAEVQDLTLRLNDEFTPARRARPDLARVVDRHLTDYIAGATGQRVRTSVEVRGRTLAGLAFPFALGACDILSSDVAIFKDTGAFEPHVIAHEFTHRKGYWKELHAQVLAYLSMMSSGDPELRQSARLERLYRDLRVLAGEDIDRFATLVTQAGLRRELVDNLLTCRVTSGAVAQRIEAALRGLYDARMRVTGQNGISDYDQGFTDFLYTFAVSPTARQRPPSP